MPDNWRFSEEDPEQSLRDLGARIEYPPTPDLAHAVRRELDEEERPRRSRRTWRRPHLLAPRWTAVTAALVLVAVVALSPALRTTLSDLFVPHEAGLEAGGSAAKPGNAGSESRYKQEPGVASQGDAAAPAAGAPEAATSCPSPTLEAIPARAAAGAKFRLRGHGFSSDCDKSASARDIEIFFRQDGKTIQIATIDAGRDLAFDTRLHVPKHAEPGRATVLAGARSGERAEARFVVLG